MKKLFNILALLLITSLAIAQAPQGIPYQAAARNSSGAILASTNISVRFTIRDSIATGVIKYQETHSVTTTAQGMFHVNVGLGTPLSGTFSSINWGTNAKFMQVEMDPSGGSSYIEMGSQQLMSVPYSLYSKNGMPDGVVGDIIYYNGLNWVKLPAGSVGQILTIGSSGLPIWANIETLSGGIGIGDTYGGGKIFYILQPGDPGYIAGQTKGLIAAPIDQGVGIQWGCNGITVGGTSTALGTGSANTSIVSAACGTGTAARICADLILSGYSDWYLPSLDELGKLYLSRAIVGGFSADRYWSSSEFSPSDSRFVNFSNGEFSNNNKYTSYTFYVRAIRSFSCPETPNNITGSLSVCLGSTTILNSSTTGGVWTSNNTSVATVSSTGVVTGVTAGTATISYTVTSSCGSASTSQIVTVNPLPSAGTITGTATVTAGSTTTLSNTTTGGTWSSSSTGIATVGGTGVVTGVEAGTSTISYTVTNTCGIALATRVVTVAIPTTIGATYGGGKIAYILQPGDPGYIAGETHGLIAAPSDQSTTGIQWGCNNTLVGSISTALGTGAANTSIIVSALCGTSTAARICADLILSGYSDWYLPSRDELNKLYINKSYIGGFSTGFYWSSSEVYANVAWSIYFVNGSDGHYGKVNTFYVRAIRSF